jgi:hypothetical protein
MIGVYGVSQCYSGLIGTLLGGIEVAVVDIEGRVCHECVWIPDMKVSILEVS